MPISSPHGFSRRKFYAAHAGDRRGIFPSHDFRQIADARYFTSFPPRARREYADETRLSRHTSLFQCTTPVSSDMAYTPSYMLIASRRHALLRR